MIPSCFVALERLPLTPNGKIDRKALPEPEGRLETGTPYTAPGTPTEERLVLIWEQVLGLERVGIDDNFFDLGGHSLKVIALVSRIRQEFNAEVPIRQVFQSPTVRGLADQIARARQSAYPAIEPAPPRERYPLSSAQKRIYALCQLEPGSPVYNVSAVMELGEGIDSDTLEQAFRDLIKRHESLRTSFAVSNGELTQQIHQEADFHLGYRAVGEEEVATAAGEFLRPFDLGQAPLLRASILKTPARRLLLFDTHHIIADGVSLGILTRDLASLLSGADLPEPRFQYRDYALWQNGLSGTGLIRRQEQYWLDLFSGEIPVLNLPTDYPRPSLQSFEGDRILFQLDRKTTQEIRGLSRETGTTPYMVLLAAFNILLARYAGQEEIITGTVTAGRVHTDLNGMVGMFVNTLPIRTSPSGDKTCRSFLSEVRERVLSALENQDYQFEELVDQVVKKRDPGRNPLFDALFVLQDPEFTAGSKGLTLTTTELTNNTSKFDLLLSALEEEEGIGFDLEYCARLFRRDTVQRMAGHYLNLLREITADPDQALSSLQMLSGEERRQVLHDFNDTAADYPKDQTVHQLFEEQVARTPESVALVFEDRQLTYRELNRRANQLARLLRSKGVGRDTIVGIMVERSLEMIIGLLGIVKAGGAYLPLDPDYPKERISFMLEDSNAGLLLTQSRLRERIEFPGEIIDLDDSETFRGEDAGLESINKPEDLLYVIYTSGSTGTPKGVMIEHRGVVNLIKGASDMIDLGSNQVMLSVTTIVFDIFVFESWLSLARGMRVVIAGEGEQKDPERLSAVIRRNNIQVMQTTPSRFQMLMLDEEQASCLKQLSIILLGGEPLPEVLLKKLKETGASIYNGYGPTETAVYSTFADVTMVEQITIGRPLANTRVYILDRHANPVPVGVSGELCLGGAGLARGYLNRPELTAEKFVANPFIPGERMYRTGDLARWLPDGNIEFLGRIDHQVKIRGFRVELGEIETGLLTHQSVREAVVTARDDQAGTRYLCAYIVADSPLSTPELREHLSRRLPDYMIPSCFVALERLPLTPNGKIDRKALPEPEGRLETGTPLKDLPLNALEAALLGIWEDVLGISPIGVNENFFDLGGNSLLSIRLLIKTSEVLGRKLPFSAIFQTQTITKLAALLSQGNPPRTLAACLSPSGSGTPFFGVHIPVNLRLGLDKNFSFYSFHYGSTFSSCIENIAAQYLAEVYKIQPSGPYLLGGFSIGAVIAFEMAQQLLAQGQEVALLFLLDPTWELAALKGEATWLEYWISYIVFVYRNNTLAKKSLSQKLAAISAYIKKLPQTVKFHLNINDSPSPAEASNYDEKIYQLLANRYHPKLYPGKATMFYSNEAKTDDGLARYLTGDFEEHRINTDHLGFNNETAIVNEWVAILNRRLQELSQGRIRRASGG
jgi:amino acid adenylation domain-containing protein